MNSNLSNSEIDVLIKLLREDYLATKINVDSELMVKLDLDSLTEEYKAIKEKLETLRPKEELDAKIHPDPEKLLSL